MSQCVTYHDQSSSPPNYRSSSVWTMQRSWGGHVACYLVLRGDCLRLEFVHMVSPSIHHPPPPPIRFHWLVFQIFAGTRWLQLWNFLYHSLADLEPEKHAAFRPTSSPSRKSLLHGRKLIARIPSCLGVWTNPSPSSYATAVASSRSWSFQGELWCSGVQLIEFGKHWRYCSWLAWCRDWSFVHAHFSYTFNEWSGGNSLSQSSSVCLRTWTSENYFWRQFVDGDQPPFTRA